MPPRAGYAGTPMDRACVKVLVGDECWEWTASLDGGGYGHLQGERRGKFVAAHRLFYEHFVGPIPAGLQLDHLCRNRRCVRPKHLEPVTVRENLLRGETVTAGRAATTHCPLGHEYTPENTAVSSRGQRGCRECIRARDRRRSKSEHRKEWVKRNRAERDLRDPSWRERRRAYMREWKRRRREAAA